jgi:uncharacterized protein YidB (DUF937 family)
MGFWDIFKRAPKEAERATATAATAAGAGSAATAGAAAVQPAAADSALAVEWKEIGKLFGEAGEKFSGLMDKMKAAGLDDKLKSWIGKGENEAVTAEQVTAALGADEVAAVAKDMGVSENEAASKLAKLLPSVIDKLTPDGLVPDPEGLAKKLTSLLK